MGTRAYPFPSLEDSRLRKKSFSAAVNRWLCRTALRGLLEVQRQGRPLPSSDILAQALLSRAESRGARHIDRDGEVTRRSPYKLTQDQLNEMADSAARWALDTYDPDYLEKQSERGKRSKRPPKFTVPQLDAVADLSMAEQARALGCSLATVSRLRSAQAARKAAPPVVTGDPEMDALLAEED